ncbi:MAG: hypothetical protein N3H31_05415 [Candidatus Nezhaarchaeota archaeon]|nr:hypothetical protein [Candidatus Nezhaarchaeota archaeon]
MRWLSLARRASLAVRCCNCFHRIAIKPGAELATCPRCNIEYRIAWVAPDQPLIRGPAKWPE